MSSVRVVTLQEILGRTIGGQARQSPPCPYDKNYDKCVWGNG